MKERPILFSGPMVKAILDGKKTMTRRAVKKQPIDMLPMNVPNQWCALDERAETGNRGSIRSCRFGVPGERLWVREAFGIFDAAGNERVVGYRADGEDGEGYWREVLESRYFQDDYFPADEKWRPSIHMPRWASRITLEITDVRVERLQEITEEDARAEGVYPNGFENGFGQVYPSGGTTPYRRGFAMVWDSINGKKYPWASNPWVWVVSFKRI